MKFSPSFGVEARGEVFFEKNCLRYLRFGESLDIEVLMQQVIGEVVED